MLLNILRRHQANILESTDLFGMGQTEWKGI